MNTTGTAFGISFSIVSLLSAMLVLAKESYAPLLEWMKALTGHHWLTHAVLVVVAFVALGLALPRVCACKPSGGTLAAAVLISTLVSGLIVAGFFLFA